MSLHSGRAAPYLVGFVLGEALIIALGAVIAVYLRIGTTAELFSWRYSWPRLLLVPIILEVTFYYFDLHSFRVNRSFAWVTARVAQAMAVGTLTLAVIYYILPRLFLGRGVLLLSYFTITLLVLLWRGLYAWALSQRVFSTRLIIIGHGSLADSIIDEVISRSDNVYSVVCLVDLTPPRNRAEDAPEPADDIDLMPHWASLLRAELRHDADELAGLVRFTQADMIVVAADEKRGKLPLEGLLRCRVLGVPIITGEDFYEQISGRILAERIRPGWLIFSPGFTQSRARRFTKRLMDVTLSALGLALSLPLAVLTAVAVKLDSRGPVLFSQQRVGHNDRLFTIYKFRSMVQGAEDGSGPVWAQENDPRVTRVGRMIRKLRLDEIPQLWNVLRGDMSFVGPRPERPHFVDQLSAELPYYRERHTVKPGVTGWAQISYPYGSSVAAALEKLNYDLYYIKHSSFSMDVMIILRTIKIILFGGGGR